MITLIFFCNFCLEHVQFCTDQRQVLPHLYLPNLPLQSSFQALKDFPIPFWVTIFAEGTRLTPDKLLEAQTFASTKGLAIPKNVLIPRTKVKLFLVIFKS